MTFNYKDNSDRRRDRRDRYDRLFVQKQDSLHIIMPYVLPSRCCNEALMSETIDITALDGYVKAKNARNPEFKYTWFHFICAALAKTMLLRPRMNYFISGHRLFEHRNIEIAFTVKRHFEDDSEETLAKFVIDPDGDSPIEQVHSYVQKVVTKVRINDKADGITHTFNFFQNMPRFVLKIVTGALRIMEYFGFYPKSLAADDPLFCSVYLTNLGSIKMSADYHHLYEWGNNSLFAIISQMKELPMQNPDGSTSLHKTLKLSFTIDERIADGFYFAKSLKLLRHLLQHPELLEQAPKTSVETED